MFTIYSQQNNTYAGLWLEEESDRGLFRIAEKVAADAVKVTGHEFVVSTCNKEEKPVGDYVVLFAQAGKSSLLDQLNREGKIDLKPLQDKWEVFEWKLLKEPWGGAKEVLLIMGSDKRGTIYGMFRLSEQIGISPLVYWGDAVVPQKQEIQWDEEVEMLSKEPSVRYRGFFINDEWPCFGNWTMDHFDGFTVKMYDHVFELLLRLKGNILWTAMWTSSFDIDGPGDASALLADSYGVIIGNSHHEPCLRASEEWDILKGGNSGYGTEWSFLQNREGLLRYWEASLQARSHLDRMITIGMRGERDSKVLGTDATLADNINMLKDVISNQRRLIRQAEKDKIKKSPQLLVLYKEVEEYFYGNEQAEGLHNWEELKDVILMLCDDNFGNLRTLPDEELIKHPGGFGMYYHFDYHGEPVSYEWMNSTPLTKTWEQMSMAYDHGVRSMWIVNVGDLKFNEFPLSYFLALAYDYEKWGSSAPNTTDVYTKQFMAKHFADTLADEMAAEAAGIITESVAINHIRRPEALHPDTYHPLHCNEAIRMMKRVKALQIRSRALRETLDISQQEAYDSLIGFHVEAVTNHVLTNLYAGQNYHYAGQGRKTANTWGKLLSEARNRDKEIAAEIRSFKEGKWKGMELAVHTGFIKWNEDGCRYPVQMQVEPFDRPRMAVARTDKNEYCVKNYGTPCELVFDDFLYEGNSGITVEISNEGIGTFEYKVNMPSCQWLSVSSTEGTVEDYEKITFFCDRSKLTHQQEEALVKITDGDTLVVLRFRGEKTNISDLPAGTFLPDRGWICMEAAHYSTAYAPEGYRWVELKDYGLSGSGMKVYPDTYTFTAEKEPALFYQIAVRSSGTYQLELQIAPTNPLNRQSRLNYGAGINDEAAVYYNTVPADYQIGALEDLPWVDGVLNNRRICRCPITLKTGLNTVGIYAPDGGLVLERILIFAEGTVVPMSCFGPPESYRL